MLYTCTYVSSLSCMFTDVLYRDHWEDNGWD